MVMFDENDSDKIVTGGLDGVINIWDSKKHKIYRKLNGDEGG